MASFSSELSNVTWEPVLKVSFVRFQSATLASNAKRQRYSVAGAFEMIFVDGRERGGMSSGEESELHRKLENPSEESREVICKHSIFKCVTRVVLKQCKITFTFTVRARILV